VNGNHHDKNSFRNKNNSMHSNTPSEIWGLVSTPEWSMSVRPTHRGKWDKHGTGDRMVRAFFTKILGFDKNMDKLLLENRKRGVWRFVVPTFHWTGASSLNQMKTTVTERENVISANAREPVIFDAVSGLGYCGDV